MPFRSRSRSRKQRRSRRGGENTFMSPTTGTAFNLGDMGESTTTTTVTTTTPSDSMSMMGGSRRRRGRRGGSPLVSKPMVVAPTTTTVAVTTPSAATAMKPVMAAAAPMTGPVTKGGRRRRMRGGDGGASWVLQNFGGGEDQWNNTFGPASITQQGNLLPTVQGAPAVLANNIPQGAAPVQQGGRRRSRKGGYWSSVLQQALVPFALLGIQNKFSKGRRYPSGQKTRKLTR